MVNSTSACDAVLDIKHGGWGVGGGCLLGLRQPLPWHKVLHRLSTIPFGLSSYFTRELSSAFMITFYTRASKSTSTLE